MTREEKNISRFFKLTGLFFLVLTAVVIIHACNNNEEQSEKTGNLKRVEVMTINPTSVKQTVTISGKLETEDSTSLAFKIGGRIDSISNDVGDFVKKNTAMASLELDEIKAQAAQARLNYNKMKRDFERVKSLYEEQAATKSQYEDMTTAFEAAEEQLKIADYNLDHSIIKAPFDGYVAMRRHEPGEMIAQGDPVYIFVGKTSELKVVSGVAGLYVSRIKPGAEATVKTPSFPDYSFAGKVLRVGVVADMATGTFPIEINIENKNRKLKPGMTVNTRIEIGNGNNYLLIPPQALVEADEDRGYVFVFDPAEKKVEKTPVKIGDIHDDMIEITSGLEKGMMIVKEGADYLVSGEKVQVVSGEDKGKAK